MNPTIRKDILKLFSERASAVQTEVLADARVSLFPAISQMLTHLACEVHTGKDPETWRWPSPIPEPRALVAEFFSGFCWKVRSLGLDSATFEFNPLALVTSNVSGWHLELVSRAEGITFLLLEKILGALIDGVREGSPVRVSFTVKAWHRDSLSALFPELTFGPPEGKTISYRPWDLALPLPRPPSSEEESEEEASSDESVSG